MTLLHGSRGSGREDAPVAPPVPAALLRGELEEREPLAVFRGLDLHDFTGAECPATMREVGRLREAGFRAVGAGRGGEVDLDALDFGPNPYRQLVAWDPEVGELVAVYRYQFGDVAPPGGGGVLRTATLFRYSREFDREVRPAGIELGRSVVSGTARRRLLGLFALWTGLRALLDRHPSVEWFFGNVSLYRTLPVVARDRIVAFLERWYGAEPPLLVAREGLRHHPDPSAVRAVEGAGEPGSPEEAIRILAGLLRGSGTRVPPILQSYLAIARELHFGETARDSDFGDALEVGIVVPVAAARKAGQLGRFERGGR